MKCILCNQTEVVKLEVNPTHKLCKCNNCHLIFKDPATFPTIEEERERYLKHNNSERDNGYIEHLEKAIKPFLKYSEIGSFGLDYGCGYQPVLEKLLSKEKMRCDNYDPLFFPDLPDERKDFIFVTEAVEHFHHPVIEFSIITSLLIPGGLLTVMTNMWDENTDFSNWWYLNDSTHVLFYNTKTFEYISQKFGYDILENDGKEVILLRKYLIKE